MSANLHGLLTVVLVPAAEPVESASRRKWEGHLVDRPGADKHTAEEPMLSNRQAVE
jgi:hypothetical protein